MSEPEVVAVRPAVAQTLIGVKKTKFYELLASGEIQSFLAGTKTRLVPVTEIQAYLARKLNEHAPHTS